ncbi:TPA: ribonuclease H family protein [Vibrio cholerae]|nr:ribonuclease H family protein [Vibrio cholerae]
MDKKVYVVWVGRTTGVMKTWAETQAAVNKFPGAKYKSFPSSEASLAFKKGWKAYYSEKSKQHVPEKPLFECLTVDASYSQKTQELIYRGVLNVSKEEVFRSKVFISGSANIGEYLAIVDGIKYLMNSNVHNLPLIIYSDSANAIYWHKNKAHNSDVIRSGNADTELVRLMGEADQFLRTCKDADSIEIRKWHTKEWSQEIPADFGKK